MVSPRTARPLIARLSIPFPRRPSCICTARQDNPATGPVRLSSASSSSRFSRRCFSSQPRPSDRAPQTRPPVRHGVAQEPVSAGSARGTRTIVAMAVLGAVAFYLYNSQTVPVTGRRRFNFLSEQYVEYAHAWEADEVVRMVREDGGYFLPAWDPRTIMVRRVMRKLIRVSGLSSLDWEVHVIADNHTANAFVLPGGKVFVHSGLLSLCRNEDAVAAILGHEIAHNTASHAAERLSAAWAVNLTTGSLFFLAGIARGMALYLLWTAVGGLYLPEFLHYLPIGRMQEVEADYLGLMMMAEACYDPREAVRFWRRMEVLQRLGEEELPEVLSTHPSNTHRVTKMTEWLPLAMEKRAQSDCKGTSSFADRFRIALRRRIPLNEVEGP